MKNFFDNCCEAVQDRFFTWLFENWNCEDEEVKNASLNFIKYCTKFKFGKIDIVDVVCFEQFSDMDVVCNIGFKNNCHSTIVIEDKTLSFEHNQLKLYNDVINKGKFPFDNNNIFKVFVKPYPICKQEKYRVLSMGWAIVDLDDLLSIFSNFRHAKNLLLNDFVEYLFKIKEESVVDNVKNLSGLKESPLKWLLYLKQLSDFLNMCQDEYELMVEPSKSSGGYFFLDCVSKRKYNDDIGIDSPYKFENLEFSFNEKNKNRNEKFFIKFNFPLCESNIYKKLGMNSSKRFSVFGNKNVDAIKDAIKENSNKRNIKCYIHHTAKDKQQIARFEFDWVNDNKILAKYFNDVIDIIKESV